MRKNYSRRDILSMIPKIAAVPLITYAIGCSNENDDNTVQQLTGRPISLVLDNFVANYNGSNVISVVGETAPSIDVVSLVDINQAFQYATSQASQPTYLDSEIIPEDPLYTRNIFTIGTELNNLVIESFAREYQPEGISLPPSGIGVLQSFSLVSGLEAIAIMAQDGADRRKSARVIAEALLDPTMHDLNGNIVYVFGDVANPYTQVVK